MDIIESIHGSTIQHGPHNNRVYLMRADGANIPALLPALDGLAAKGGYSKIFARIPAPAWPDFRRAGYRREAVVPGLYRGVVDGLFLGKYFSEHRADAAPSDGLLQLLKSRTNSPSPAPSPGMSGIASEVVQCGREDAGALSRLYGRVFDSYPFPIDDPGYIQATMSEGVRYFGVKRQDDMAAAAAAEIDMTNNNAEMTDFATLPVWRRHGFAAALLQRMESAMAQDDIYTVYTIARAESISMNTVFSRAGYFYGGFLPNNTQIAGTVQSMTVWYKSLV